MDKNDTRSPDGMIFPGLERQTQSSTHTERGYLLKIHLAHIERQGRNQERANRVIARHTKFLQTWRSRTAHEKLFLETALPVR